MGVFMSIVEIKISSFSQYIDLALNGINRKPNLIFTDDFAFRGVNSSNFMLKPSLFRNYTGNINLEKSLLRNFRKRLPNHLKYRDMDIWDIMILGQRHGLSTRLLDWSRSPLVALHFATVPLNNENSAVWKINLCHLNNNLLHSTLSLEDKVKHIFTIEDIKKATKSDDFFKPLDKFDKQFKSIIMFAPPNIDERISNQSSLFTIANYSINCYEDYIRNNNIECYKYIIPYNIKLNLRESLDKCNISEESLFPGLDGLTQFLNRHYRSCC